MRRQLFPAKDLTEFGDIHRLLGDAHCGVFPLCLGAFDLEICNLSGNNPSTWPL